MRVLAALLALMLGTQATSSPRHITIPFLANASKPAALEFEAAECEVDKTGGRMDCIFQQVFLTTSNVAPDTCLVTTNRYGREFERDSATRWIAREPRDGPCGVVDVVTLDDGGGGRWTMETRRTVAGRDASCRAETAEVETFSWRNIRRPLPCRFVQPGGLLP